LRFSGWDAMGWHGMASYWAPGQGLQAVASATFVDDNPKTQNATFRGTFRWPYFVCGTPI